MAVDTYSVSVQYQGYAIFSLQGVTVSQDETFPVNAKLAKSLRTIARVGSRARSITSAFQPDQTIDRTVVNAAGIDQLLGKSFVTDGKQLLSELPGVNIDKNGTVLIRGGTSFESALEFEGIDYTEPNRSLSDRFENVGSNYLLNGVGSLEIIPGGGDATRGNTGTGLIALTAKRGTYPSFGNLDYESGILGNAHQFGFEYGFATLKGTLSNYFDFIGEDRGFQYGPYGISASGIIADPTSINPNLQSLETADQRRFYTTSVFNIANQSSRDFLDNAVFKFGKNKAQQLQLFVQAQALHQNLDYGGAQILTAVPQLIGTGLNFVTYNGTPPNYTTLSSSLGYLFNRSGAFQPAATPAEQAFINRFAPEVVGAVPGNPLTSPETIDSPFSAYKLEYDNNLNASTFLAARFYRTDDAASETLPSQGLYVPQEGGIRRGVATDITKIFGEHHTLRVGGKYEFAVPFGERENAIDYSGAFDGVYGFAPNGGTTPLLTPFTHDVLADFVQPATPVGPAGAYTSGTPGCVGEGLPSANVPLERCGYLYKFFPNGPPRLPAEVETPLAKQQSYGLYAQDTYSPNARLHVLAGLRLDGYNFQLPGDAGDPPAVDGIRHQRLYEPKLGVSYRLGDRDAVRGNFGRSLSIPLPTFLGTSIDRASLAAFANIPSYDNVTGKVATYCGLPGLVDTGAGTIFIGNKPCASYADQLYWLLRNARFASQSQITSPLRGATFTNYDFTYSHEFRNGFAVKATPFYRRGFDVVETSQTLEGIDPLTGTQQLSPEIQSNLGSQNVTGLEFEITTPQRPTGLSATITATYANQFGNDPPGDYLPTASLQLGEVYHSPNLAPLQGTIAATYRTNWGLRINPILTFKSGYPYGVGVYQALTVNGQPLYIPYTDAVYQGLYGGLLANGQVNPQDPGTAANPNIFATRGTEGRTSGPGSLYSPEYINVDLTASLTPRNSTLTYGVSITNLFNRTSSVPYPNFSRDCQTVYTGLCASVGLPSVSDALHSTPQTSNGASSAYQVFLNQTPIAIRAYIQAGI